jgi:hypothetical protein
MKKWIVFPVLLLIVVLIAQFKCPVCHQNVLLCRFGFCKTVCIPGESPKTPHKEPKKSKPAPGKPPNNQHPPGADDPSNPSPPKDPFMPGQCPGCG